MYVCENILSIYYYTNVFWWCLMPVNLCICLWSRSPEDRETSRRKRIHPYTFFFQSNLCLPDNRILAWHLRWHFGMALQDFCLKRTNKKVSTTVVNQLYCCINNKEMTEQTCSHMLFIHVNVSCSLDKLEEIMKSVS